MGIYGIVLGALLFEIAKVTVTYYIAEVKAYVADGEINFFIESNVDEAFHNSSIEQADQQLHKKLCKKKVSFASIISFLKSVRSSAVGMVLTTILLHLLYEREGFSLTLVFTILLGLLLGIGAAIDKQCFILPDEALFLLIFTGFLYSCGGQLSFPEVGKSLLLGTIIFLGLYKLSKGGIGLGDVKWAIALGLWYEPFAYSLMIGFAFFLGGLQALWTIVYGHTLPYIPFGPSLALSAFSFFVFEEELLSFYRHFFMS